MKKQLSFALKIALTLLLGIMITFCQKEINDEKVRIKSADLETLSLMNRNPTPEEIGVIPEATVPLLTFPEVMYLKEATALPSSLSPEIFTATLAAGESVSETLTASISGAPPKGDVLFMMDLTGSMSGELSNAKTNSINIMNGISSVITDAAFGVVSHMDYNGSFSSCGYSDIYGVSGDYPYSVDQPINSDKVLTQNALNSLNLGNGYDVPEDYTRVLWETYSDPTIAWRPGARKFVVSWLDAMPHDCGIGTGADPGRDGIMGTSDDLPDILPVLQEMKAQNITLIVLYSGLNVDQYWKNWAQETGGDAFQINNDGTIPGGVDIATYITSLIEEETGTIDNLTVQVCTPGFESWLVSPPVWGPIDLTTPWEETFSLTLTVPVGTLDGVYEFDLCLIGDGAEYGKQHVTITVQNCIIRYETAFGGEISINPGKQAWFYLYKPDEGPEFPVANIYANRTEIAGTVQLIYDEGMYFMQVLLTGDWSLKEDYMESVKVQGLDIAPSKRLTGKQFDYKGTDLYVPVGTTLFPYYVIHLDLQICE